MNVYIALRVAALTAIAALFAGCGSTSRTNTTAFYGPKEEAAAKRVQACEEDDQAGMRWANAMQHVFSPNGEWASGSALTVVDEDSYKLEEANKKLLHELPAEGDSINRWQAVIPQIRHAVSEDRIYAAAGAVAEGTAALKAVLTACREVITKHGE